MPSQSGGGGTFELGSGVQSSVSAGLALQVSDFGEAADAAAGA